MLQFLSRLVVGRYMATARGSRAVETWIRSPLLKLPLALAAFIAGNACNLYYNTYPISSLLFTAALAFCGASVANFITRRSLRRSAPRVDPFNLYLLHEPFAFPLIVGSQILFGSFAVAVGLPVYFLIVFLATAVFSKVLAILRV